MTARCFLWSLGLLLMGTLVTAGQAEQATGQFAVQPQPGLQQTDLIVWSGREGKGRPSELLSPEFTIQRRFLNFRVAGERNLPGQVGVELLVKDRVVRAANATESSDPQMVWRTWDIGELVGTAISA